MTTNASGTRAVPRAWVLWFIVGAAIVPRVLHLTASLWYDEVYASRLKLTFSSQGLAWIFYDTHPPLYNVLMLFWNHLFGDSELSLRMLPLLCSLATIVIAARLAREMAGERVAMAVGLLMALSGASVYYAQEARSYSLIMLLFVLMIWSLVRYGRTAAPKDCRRFVVLSFLCSITHLYSIVFVLCLTAALCLRVARRHNIDAVLRLALLQLVLLVPFYFSLLLLTFFTKEHFYPGLFGSFSGPQALELLSFFLFGYPGLTFPWPVHVLGIAVFVFGLIGLRRLLRRQSMQRINNDGDGHTFTFPGMDRVFIAVATAGIVVFGGLATLPRFVRADFFAVFIQNQEHHLLMERLVSLISRTAVLYLVGYLCALIAWLALRTQPLSRLPMHRSSHKGEPFPSFARWIDAILLYPLLALIAVAVFSRAICPNYNSRYMLPLLPLFLLPVAVAIGRISGARASFAGFALVALVQLYSLKQQGPIYAYLRPDYRAAVRYLDDSGWNGYPVASTAYSHEALNVAKYYCRRFGIPELQSVPVADVPTLSRVSLLVPVRYPAGHDRAGDMQRWTSGATQIGRVDLPGVSVYELDRRPVAELPVGSGGASSATSRNWIVTIGGSLGKHSGNRTLDRR